MEKLIKLLAEKGLKIATAESCTGGLIAKKITDISGASAVFGLGVTTYSNEAKMKLLGVKPETLENYGAVSEETAYEMVKGIKSLADADIAIAVTGIAGPKSDNTNKPVGMVCIGIAYGEKTEVKTHYFKGNRDEIREITAETALNSAYNAII